MAKAKKTRSRKRVTVKLLERKHAGKVTEAYKLMEDLIATKRADLKEAKIAIGWRFGWHADADGRLRLGQMRKASDLDRAFKDFDFVMLLNHQAWNTSGIIAANKRAVVIYHELCHAMPAMDANGEQKRDEEGRWVWRTRKHDIEEFQEVVAVYGCHSHELESFAAAGLHDKDRPLLAEAEKAEVRRKAKKG